MHNHNHNHSVATPPEPPVAPTTLAELRAMNVRQLQDFVREHSLQVVGGRRKANLLAAAHKFVTGE